MPDAALVLPRSQHVVVGIESLIDWPAAGRLAWRNGGRGVAVRVRFGGVEGGRGDDGSFATVAIAFQDFFRCDVGAVAEEAGVV